MQTMTRPTPRATAQELRAEPSRRVAHAQELLDARTGGAYASAPALETRPPFRPARVQAVDRAPARRRRMRAMRVFARRLAGVIWAIVVGVVAGVLLYLLATLGVTKLVDGAYDTPAPTSATP